MKNKFLISRYVIATMMLVGILLISCEEEAIDRDMVAPLSANFETSSMFLEVNTTNLSMNGRRYAWDFGVDGTDEDTSIEFAPSFTYEVGGTYTITLTVRGDDGQEVTVTQEITVSREMINPMAAFTSEADFLEVTFTDASENAESYAWDFGDGTGTSTDANPTYTYTEAGTYAVSLTVTSATDDTDTTTVDVTVEEMPVTPTADFTFDATDLMVSFTDASVTNGANITAFAWDFGDGMGTSMDQNPMYTYAATGDFEVSLTITFDEVNGETSSSTTQTVSVTAGGGNMMDGPGTPGNQFAFITDTDPGDTGELRLDLDNTLAMGRMTVVVSKEMTQDGFINLSGSSTSRSNAMIDMRINDANGYEFTESGDSVNATANFPAFVNDEFVAVDITWDATVTGAPLITVTIDGQPVTAAPFPSEGGATAIAEGVRTVQFRLGGGSSTDDTGAGFFVDNLRVYDTSSGAPVLVFEDDYESYNVGDSLDPDVMPTAMDTPYRNNSSEAVVGEE